MSVATVVTLGYGSFGSIPAIVAFGYSSQTLPVLVVAPEPVRRRDRVVASKLLICNMALASVGSDKIEALEELSSGAAQCTLWYDHSRIQALESHDWNFARRRVTLVAHADDSPSGVWVRRYQYPSDCLVIRGIQHPMLVTQVNKAGLIFQDSGDLPDAIPFDVELDVDQDSKSIVTNLGDAVMVYTWDIQDTALFSPYFVKLLAAALASNIAYALTGKTDVEDRMIARFTALNLAAPAFNANEQMRYAPRDASWVRGR